jgi:hypothetical protein
VRDTARKTAGKGQSDPRAFLGFVLIAIREGSKLILRCPKPGKRPRGFVFFRHFPSLALWLRISPSFDPRMPVL